MRITIGTENTLKVSAVKEVMDELLTEEYELLPISTDSGVTENPLTHTEAISGARNRARGSLSGTNAAFGVGIEGNLFQESSQWFLTTWVVIINSSNNKEYIAQGISVQITEQLVIDQIDSNQPVGHVFKSLPANHDYEKYGNPMNYLTGGVFDRSDALKIAVRACFSQVLRDVN